MSLSFRRSLDLVSRALSLLACCVLVLGLRDTPRVEPAPRPPAPSDQGARAGARVCVDVVDGAGRALSGVTVRAYAEQPERRFAVAGETSTVAGGPACLDGVPHGTLWLLAESRGYARASMEQRITGAARFRMTLVPAARLGVTVHDELSEPIASATVLVTGSDPLPFGKLTDAGGQARFERLPAAPWELEVRAPGYESAKRSGVREDTTVTLKRLASLDVRVVDGSGAAVDEAAVVIAGPTLWPARRATTDGQGLAKIQGLSAGTYDLSAHHGSRLSAPLLGLELARGAHESITLRLEAGRMVTALVTDGDAADAPPVPGADVVLVEGGVGSFPLRGRTGADGTVVLGPIGHAPATLAARAPDFVGGPLVAVPDVLTGPVRVALERGATLRGEVVDARGFPVDSAQIEIIGTDRFGLPIAETPLAAHFRARHFAWALGGPRPLIPSGELGVMPGPVPPIPRAGAPLGTATLDVPLFDVAASEVAAWITSRTGEFTARPVTPGRVRALVRHPEYVEGASELVTVPPKGEARVRVVLLRGGRLEGRVLDDRGFPVENAVIDLVATHGTFERSTRSSRDGTFAFAAVPAKVTLSASRPEDLARIAARRSVHVPEGERVDVELVLPARRDPVRVVVTDEQGAPIELAEVRVASLDPAVPLRQTLFTDASGAVELDDARDLALRVSVDAPRLARAQRDVERAPAEIRITLDPGVLVTGRVTAVRGRVPVSRAVVVLRAGVHRQSTLTDDDGAFRFNGVAPGTVQLSVSHPDYADVDVQAEIQRTGRADRAFELPAIDLVEPGEVRGRVVDHEDRPVEGARVAVGVAPAYLPQGALPAGVAVTDRDGAFVLRGLAPGSVRLQAYAAGVGRGQLDGVDVRAGRTTEDVTLRLTERDSEVEPLASGGVAITLGERPNEIVVVQVASGSEAERAGFLPGDILERIDGARPSSMNDARTRFAGPAGSDLIVDVRRGNTSHRLRVTREPIRR